MLIVDKQNLALINKSMMVCRQWITARKKNERKIWTKGRK